MNNENLNVGKEVFANIRSVYNYRRSLSGEGVRQTLRFIKQKLPNLEINYFETGKRIFDWTAPKEWKVTEAYVADMQGKKIIDI